MAKNRNKKNRAKSGGLATMDTSEGGPATSTAADVPQPMDTSEGKQPSSPPRRSVRSTSKLKVLHCSNCYYFYIYICVHRGSFRQLLCRPFSNVPSYCDIAFR
ncbi:uncharacterized protein LOC100193249 [Zea mays]|uniref:Uncharacterized protein n=1 Tax=Zea mays TaxID=4577 RepID=B4FED1_MAIZE|nr:uncharacterized protein LOC100193249 [Zea mays]ACF80474.1 unknown [Zea mays]|eukprot:NP_001131870.1 uncharacterized protein LOC100193249 [Zea mays]